MYFFIAKYLITKVSNLNIYKQMCINEVIQSGPQETDGFDKSLFSFKNRHF